MAIPHPLPPELPTSFRVADAQQSGVDRERLRRSDLQHPFHGARSRGLDLGTVLGRCEAYLPLLRDGDAFSHVTAAELWCAPLPHAGRAGIHVSAPSPRRAPESQGVVGHQMRMSAGDLRQLGSVPITSPALTWASLASTLRLEDLVAVGDFLVTPPFRAARALCSLDELHAETERRSSQRGHRIRVQGVRLVRVGSLSRPETHLRLLLVAARLPEPQINLAADGLLLDLAWPDLRVCVEYEGDHHRDPGQFRRDIRRIERLVDAGWIVIRVTAADLYRGRRELVTRIAQRLRTRGWRGDFDLRRIVASTLS